MDSILIEFLRFIGLFIKGIFWFVSFIIRISILAAIIPAWFSLYVILSPFLLLFSIDKFKNMWSGFGESIVKTFKAFFPEFYSNNKNNHDNESNQQGTQLIGDSNNRSIVSKNKIINIEYEEKTKIKNCISCGMELTESIKEKLNNPEFNDNIYCSFCGNLIN